MYSSCNDVNNEEKQKKAIDKKTAVKSMTQPARREWGKNDLLDSL